ncbi:ethanolamine ammonia-lyase subunit EutC [Maribacter dokdonensis]|uniref:ethanolamine ammonia-lyase subunit EutC n=1 Tax=Maribacter dokdonensis TaxID=320912 RepID=UPI0027372573|nr:ethanolamine ammonia-lyase subunit EutC [Maribacter dokdonensis]MDP2525411.1 ethanolamine ammonia-lyase subunit EutC [Maribacter dokdonensis]
MSKDLTIANKWQQLKEHTKARVALGHVGTSLPLCEVLALKHAHAMAKDAIVTKLDVEGLSQKCKAQEIPYQTFKSRVSDRLEYLKRPDLGRQLLFNTNLTKTEKVDIVFVITDGLSAKAVNTYAFKVLNHLLPNLNDSYTFAVTLVEHGRVAIGDAVAEFYHADFVAVCIGERPGLSSPESMGIYTTYHPKIGFTDERRNCISNIHANGLSGKQGAQLLQYLIEKSFALKISGVTLKLEVGEILKI